MKRIMLSGIVLLFLAIPASECAAQNISQFFQGSFREYRQRIARYATGGIYSRDYISPYYRTLRIDTPSPYSYRQIRPQMDARRERLDNRDDLRRQAARISSALGTESLGRRGYTTATGHTTRFQMYRP